MSKQFDNTNRFTLFKNNEKKNERGPDYSGSLNVDGAEFFIDAWIRESEGGRKFMSGSIKRKEKQPAKAKPKDERYRAGAPADDDDAPF